MNTEDKINNPAPKATKIVNKVAAKPVPKTSTKTVAKPASAPTAVVKPTSAPATVVKPVATIAPAVVVEEMLIKKVKKDAKVKVVRDSFTMPQNEYQKIEAIKAACLKAGRHVKKSEVLRAGLQVLSNMSQTDLEATLAGLETIRTGRPKKR